MGLAQNAQKSRIDVDSVDDLLEDLEARPEFTLVIAQRLRILNDPRAIKPLRKAFESSQDPKHRLVVASALLSLGDLRDIYFEYVSEEAWRSVRRGEPYPIQVDDDGKIGPQKLDPKFLSWCSERQLDPWNATNAALYEWPMGVAAAAFARDPRLAPAFERGLKASNYMIVVHSALGLAVLQDEQWIPHIIEAAKRVPAALRKTVAKPLLLFDSPIARNASRELIDDPVYIKAFEESLPKMLPRPRGNKGKNGENSPHRNRQL